MVNGFKGGDWNELTQTMNVRQKHAHSWVEAYIGMDADEQPDLDHARPDPGDERDESVAQVGGFAGELPPVTDLLRYIWVFYILGYDSEPSEPAALHADQATRSRECGEGYATLWALDQGGRLLACSDFQSISSFISVRGFFVSFLVLSLLAIAGQACSSGWSAADSIGGADRRRRRRR